MIGYSLLIQKLNKLGDKKNVGVRLGRHCIENDISVMEVAEQLQVTRQSVYNWFIGKSVPRKDIAEKIRELYPV
jgi:predicted DNA-binding protein YlxM (UPF0122 family)